MKVVIEINDRDLEHAVNAKVAEQVALLGEAAIKAKVDEILARKFERIGEEQVKMAVTEGAKAVIRDVFGYNGIERGVREALANAALGLIKASR